MISYAEPIDVSDWTPRSTRPRAGSASGRWFVAPDGHEWYIKEGRVAPAGQIFVARAYAAAGLTPIPALRVVDTATLPAPLLGGDLQNESYARLANRPPNAIASRRIRDHAGGTPSRLAMRKVARGVIIDALLGAAIDEDNVLFVHPNGAPDTGSHYYTHPVRIDFDEHLRWVEGCPECRTVTELEELRAGQRPRAHSLHAADMDPLATALFAPGALLWGDANEAVPTEFVEATDDDIVYGLGLLRDRLTDDRLGELGTACEQPAWLVAMLQSRRGWLLDNYDHGTGRRVEP